MKRFALAALAVIAILVQPLARAADVAPASTAFAKALATPVSPCTLTGCSGFYLGGQITGDGTGVNVINLGSLNAAGTYMGVNAGYTFFNGTYWLGGGAKVEYAVAQPSANIVGSSFSDKIFAFEGIEFGGVISNMFGIPPLNLPAWLANAVPTIKVGACQNGSHLSGYCSGAAAHFFIPASRWTIDAEYLNAQYGTTTTAPGVTANTENKGSVGFTYHFQ